MGRAATRFLVFVAIGIGALSSAAIYVAVRFEAPGPLAQPTTVVIPPATGLSGTAKLLAEKGIIASRPVFVAGVTAMGGGRPLMAGEYAVPASLSARGVMELLQSGKTIVHKLTIAEGLSSAQVMAEIASAEALAGPLPSEPADGRLLPETYHYSYGELRADMVSRMARAMDDMLAFQWAHRQANLPIKTAEQALVLASIVEKETAKAEERPRVAAVFLNRLRKGMRLQSDPTVVYALTKGEHTLGRPLSRDDLETASPYNTYLIDGLPPGPIDNPGRDSLLAVVRPADSDDLYFVADGTGGHAFARTLDEHNRNVANWRKIQANGNAAPASQNVSPSGRNGASPTP